VGFDQSAFWIVRSPDASLPHLALEILEVAKRSSEAVAAGPSQPPLARHAQLSDAINPRPMKEQCQ